MTTTEIHPVDGRTKRLLRYFVRYWPRFALGIVFLVATQLLALAIPRQIGGAVQTLREGGADPDFAIQAVYPWVRNIVLLAIGAAIARIASRMLIFFAGRLIEFDIRNELFSRLTLLSVEFFESRSTGDLVSRIINDVNNIRVLFGFSTLNLVNTFVTYVTVITLMFRVSPQLAWYSLAPYPFIIAIMSLWTRALYTRTQDAQAQLSEVSTQAQEALAGADVVKAFSMQDEMVRRFTDASDEYVVRNLRLARVRGSLFPFVASIGSIGALIILYFGGRSVIADQITLGEFVEFTGYITALAWPTAGLGWALSVWQRGTASFDRLTAILTTVPQIRDPDDSPVGETLVGETLVAETPAGETRARVNLRGTLRGDIVFDGVSMIHEDGTVALNDVSVTFHGGTTTAIVGRTGSGKSSLLDLVARVRDTSHGRVLIGGHNVRALPVQTLRRAIGVVPQEPFLFSRSIRENILLGLRGRTTDDATRAKSGDRSIPIDQATRIAHLDEALEGFEEGLDTLVGERGITLSGGQKQRVTIARALVLDPDVLILDDSLAAVDTETERAILQELSALLKGRTTLFVTHRFSALEYVDQIVVMVDGTVGEVGTHEELMARNGVYAKMVEHQQLEEELSK